MASEITLKYLHPSIKTYITTENYKYDTSVKREVLFVADVFDHGKDNVLQEVNTLSEYLFKYGAPNLKKFGQAGYNIERWLTNGGSAVIMRLLPEDASYAHAVLNIQYKNATRGKTVISASGDETKINDVYLRPVVAYIGVNNTSEKLLESELAEDRSGYPTTDGYIDNFIFAVYPEGRGEYYNDLGFRIRLNPSYDGVLTSRVYTFEVVKYTSASTYDIIDGPYFVTFDPDAIDPNSQKSMFIENVVNSYSEYIKVKFNTENYIKLASVINDEVDPYIVDVISGQSRILPNGERETYFSSITGKDEDIHVTLRKYSSTGVELKNNGEYILNISNNDETTSDIVDIADNSRRVIYNNQKFVTDYMRGFYNWLIQDRVDNNLRKVIYGEAQNSFDPIGGGLLQRKLDNLIFANYKDSDAYQYSYAHTVFDSKAVGKSGTTVAAAPNNAWYLRAQEIIQPGLTDENGEFVGTETNPGWEDDPDSNVYTSTSQMTGTITEDGYISATNQNLISFYHNFMKYMQFVANYDVYNNSGFVISDDYINATEYFNKVDPTAPVWSLLNASGRNVYKKFYHYANPSSDSEELTAEDFIGDNAYPSLLGYVLTNAEYKADRVTLIPYLPVGKVGITGKHFPSSRYSSSTASNDNKKELYPVYIDDSSNTDFYIPIIDFTTYNSDGMIDRFGNYVKVHDGNGNEVLTPIKGLTGNIGVVRDTDVSIDMVLKAFRQNLIGDMKTLSGNYTITNYRVYNVNKPNIVGVSISGATPIYTNKNTTANTHDIFEMGDLYRVINSIVTNEAFDGDTDLNNYIIYVGCTTAVEDGKVVVTDFNGNISDISSLTYAEVTKKDNELFELGYRKFSLIDVLKFNHDAYITEHINVYNDNPTDDGFYVPGTSKRGLLLNIPITSLTLVYDKINDVDYNRNTSDLLTKYYFSKNDVIDGTPIFNSVFSENLKNGKLSQSFNKVSSYASLISRELDGKGKDTIIEDITNCKAKDGRDLDYSDYSLTTIFNLFVGGFESIVNNMGSITDYSNYSSLKYLIKTVNNNLDLRTTYLTLLNVHRNKVLDLSTKLAKQNASIILGEETLDTLYTAMDDIVVEANYLITNIINTILNKRYTIYDLEELDKVSDGKPYAYYFSDKLIPGSNDVKYNDIKYLADPLGVNLNISKYGTKGDNTYYYGILPLLEKILINITGQNHFGEERDTIYGGQPLVQLYDDIKNGYLLGGLTQERYETIYKVLSEALSNLSDIHSIINVFVNEKYISDIINTLIGTIDIQNTVIKYNGSSYSVNSIWELYNSGEDENLTQTKVIDLINNALDVSFNTQPLPINTDGARDVPAIQYPTFCKEDIVNSINIANENKEIIQNNIKKQDKVLASLNTICYDNLVTDIAAPLSLMEGSDGSFTYDDSTAAALKARQHRINDIRIKAYKGTWNEDVLNKDLFEFDHILDANYEDPVKNAIITLARDERQDFFYWADTKVQNTIQDALDWKSGFTNQTYFMSIISQSQVWYDEYTSRNINLTSTYLIADMLCRHIDSYGIQYPMAGSRRGVVGGFISNDWYPNEEQKEKLYKNKINYLEKDITTIRIGAQNTNYPTGPLGQINNMLVLLRVKRTVEKIAKTYQFEFNTADTRSAMAAEINVYLGNWINNGACTVATATVYASDYDIIQKIVRVDVTLQFTGVIERIVINIDCPASI